MDIKNMSIVQELDSITASPIGHLIIAEMQAIPWFSSIQCKDSNTSLSSVAFLFWTEPCLKINYTPNYCITDVHEASTTMFVIQVRQQWAKLDLVRELDRYGWTTWPALALNLDSLTVQLMHLDLTTVDIMRMLELDVATLVPVCIP